MKRIIIISNEKQISKLRPYLSDAVLIATNLIVERKLQSLGLIPKSVKDYTHSKGKHQLNLDGEIFIQNWIRNNTKFNNSLSYKDLHLFDLLSHNLICVSYYPSIREIIQMVDVLKAIITKEKPDNIITVDDKSITSEILKSMTTPTLIKSINLKDYKNEILLPKLADYLIRFKLFKGTYLKKQANLTGQIVTLAAGYNYIVPILPLVKTMKKDFIIIKPLQLKDDNILKLLREENLSFILIENLLNKNLLKMIKYHTKKLTQNFKKLLNDNTFIKSFIYHDVPIFSILKPTLEYLFIKRGKILEIIANIELSQKVLDQTKPRLVIVVEEDNLPSRALIKLAKAQNIPTLLVQHGYISKINVRSKIISNNILVWGKIFKQYIMEFDKSKKNHIYIVGRLSEQKKYEREATLKKLNISSNKKIILLATNQVTGKELILETLKAIKTMKNVQLIIRPHPMENLESLKKFIKLTKTNIFLLTGNLDEILNASDIVITFNSTVGLDALRYKKPLIIANFTGREDELDYVKSGVALNVNNQKDLKQSINLLLNDKKTKEKLLKKIKLYVPTRITNEGKKTLQKTTNLIKKFIN